MLGQRVFLDFSYEVSLNTLGHLEAYHCDPKMNLKYDEEFYNQVATENENFSSLSPNKIYDNKGPIGGGWIFDLHLQYKLSERIRFKLQ